MESKIISRTVPSREIKKKTPRGTVAFSNRVCLYCPVLGEGTPLSPQERPRWPTLGDRPADGAGVTPQGLSQRASSLRFSSKT